MSESTASLRRQIDSAADLQSVVRTMKAIAASAIGQYERSVHALADYERTVALGLSACLRAIGPTALRRPGQPPARARPASAIVFGSDQGLVGRFNETVVEHAAETLARLPGPLLVWAVGERVHARLAESGFTPAGCFAVPTSVHAITPLVWQIVVDSQRHGAHAADSELLLFYNSPASAPTYTSVSQRLLPLDEPWRREHTERAWPTKNLPEVIGHGATTLATLIGEYVFVSLFRACAFSLASENASRLAAMERADKNIDGLLDDLHGSFHRMRQSGIDEELFDVISGFEAVDRRGHGHTTPGRSA